jgi:hypothetical protein
LSTPTTGRASRRSGALSALTRRTGWLNSSGPLTVAWAASLLAR